MSRHVISDHRCVSAFDGAPRSTETVSVPCGAVTWRRTRRRIGTAHHAAAVCAPTRKSICYIENMYSISAPPRDPHSGAIRLLRWLLTFHRLKARRKSAHRDAPVALVTPPHKRLATCMHACVPLHGDGCLALRVWRDSSGRPNAAISWQCIRLQAHQPHGMNSNTAAIAVFPFCGPAAGPVHACARKTFKHGVLA